MPETTVQWIEQLGARTRSGSGTVLAAVVLGGAVVGCVDRPGLFGPGEEGAARPVVRLGTQAVALFDGDSLSFRIERSFETPVRVRAVLVDSARRVLWRSAASASVRSGEIGVAVAGVGALAGREAILLTAEAEDERGRRIYASADSVPAASLAQASVVPASVYAGRLVGYAGAAGVRDLAVEAGSSRVFFADGGRGEVRVLDPDGEAVGAAPVLVATGPLAISSAGEFLGVLSRDGTEAVVLRREGGDYRVVRRDAVPPLVVRTITPGAREEDGTARFDTLRVPIRPYAAGLALRCAEAGCGSVDGLAGSAAGGAGGGGVLRLVGISGPAPAPAAAVGFARLETDTVASRIELLGGAAGGGDSIVAAVGGASRCLTLNLGPGPFAVSPVPGGPIYSAAAAAGAACGDGTQLVRVDGAGEGSGRFFTAGARNLLAEDRVGEVQDLVVAADGSHVLVLGGEKVYVLDAALRLRGVREIEGAQGIAWLADRRHPDRFAVVTRDAVEVYEATRLLRVVRLPVGPVAPRLVAFVPRGTGKGAVLVLVAAARAGFLLADVPEALLDSGGEQ